MPPPPSKTPTLRYFANTESSHRIHIFYHHHHHLSPSKDMSPVPVPIHAHWCTTADPQSVNQSINQAKNPHLPLHESYTQIKLRGPSVRLDRFEDCKWLQSAAVQCKLLIRTVVVLDIIPDDPFLPSFLLSRSLSLHHRILHVNLHGIIYSITVFLFAPSSSSFFPSSSSPFATAAAARRSHPSPEPRKPHLCLPGTPRLHQKQGQKPAHPFFANHRPSVQRTRRDETRK